MKRAYSYDDLLLVPQYSDLGSRDDVETTTVLDQWIQLKVPIVSAPMDSVTDARFALWMAKKGGMGIIHRYQPVIAQAREIRWWHGQAKTKYGFDVCKIGASIGSAEEHELRAKELLQENPDLIAVDIAHGDSRRGLEIIKHVRRLSKTVVIVSGNVSTPEAARRVAEAGADILRVGIGAGSVCTTRMVAGVGVPQLTAISEIHEALAGYPILADGGIRSSGDIVKALAAGAAAVICGNVLSNYADTPRYEYRGMASESALVDYKQSTAGATWEGVSRKKVKLTEEQSDAAWEQLIGGIRQGLAYCGAQSLYELQEKARWVEVTARGYLEGTPHGL